MKQVLLVGLGGGIGSIARFLCHKYIYAWHPHPFPFGTLLVNVAGCFIIGLLFGLAGKGQALTPEWHLLLVTGFCGGFTTFSTFAADGIGLLKLDQVVLFALYIAGSVILGLLAAWLGMKLMTN
jgi:CrcB protein